MLAILLLILLWHLNCNDYGKFLGNYLKALPEKAGGLRFRGEVMTGTNKLDTFREISMSLLPKPWLILAVILLVLGFQGTPVAQATPYGTNITIYDGMLSGGPGWYNRGGAGTPGGGEDQEVE